MSFGNRIGAEVTADERTLFDWSYGSIVVECDGELDYPRAELLGRTVEDEALTIAGVRMPLDTLYRANTEKFARIYPDKGENHAPLMESRPERRTFVYEGEAVEHPVVYLPVFPGMNCDYDTARAFRNAGAEVTSSVLCNLRGDDILRSIREMKEHIAACHILALCGGFSAGDGSATRASSCARPTPDRSSAVRVSRSIIAHCDTARPNVRPSASSRTKLRVESTRP